MEIDPNELGPAMVALNERQRKFVMAMVERPGCSQAEAARLAGYSDASDGAKVRGHYLAHDPGVQAAIREVAGLRLNSYAVLAAETVARVLMDPDAENKDLLKAAGMLLDRTGFGAAQTINVNKTVTDRTGKGMTERIKELAAAHGFDPAKLLGVNTGAGPVIDGEFEEVKNG